MSGFEESTDRPNEPTKEKLLNNAGEDRPRWQTWASLSSLIMALLAAGGALLSAITANGLLLEKMKDINHTSRLESELLSVEVLKAKHDILMAMGQNPDVSEASRLKSLIENAGERQVEVHREDTNILITAHTHEVFSLGVTLLSIAIALCGMSVVSKRKLLWGGGLAVGAAGVILYGLGFVKMLS
jgi:hypothetical protein